MLSGPLKALLGVLAVAGYQNRDKIGEILKNLQNANTGAGDENRTTPPGQTQTERGSIGGLGDLLGGLTSGGILSNGLNDLLKTFQQNGHGEKAESWVRSGTNADIDHNQLSEALGPEVIAELSEKTGLSRDEILSRLSKDLPRSVDDMTPDGQVPSESDDFLKSASRASSFGQS